MFNYNVLLIEHLWQVLCTNESMFSAAGLSGVQAQQLNISPRGTQVKTVNAGIMFTCSVAALDASAAAAASGVEMRWQGPDMEYISSSKGSR